MYKGCIHLCADRRKITFRFDENRHFLLGVDNDIRAFFGAGDFYSWKGIKEQFSDHAAELEPIIPAIQSITAHSLANESATYTKEVSAVLTKLGIAPAGIQKQLAQQYGVDYMDGLYNRIVSQFPRPADRRHQRHTRAQMGVFGPL